VSNELVAAIQTITAVVTAISTAVLVVVTAFLAKKDNDLSDANPKTRRLAPRPLSKSAGRARRMAMGHRPFS
jgi:hypothetical protein